MQEWRGSRRLFLNERVTSVHECSANVTISGSMSRRAALTASEVGSLQPYMALSTICGIFGNKASLKKQ